MWFHLNLHLWKNFTCERTSHVIPRESWHVSLKHVKFSHISHFSKSHEISHVKFMWNFCKDNNIEGKITRIWLVMRRASYFFLIHGKISSTWLAETREMEKHCFPVFKLWYTKGFSFCWRGQCISCLFIYL
jgi:hypothetical protein